MTVGSAGRPQDPGGRRRRRRRGLAALGAAGLGIAGVVLTALAVLDPAPGPAPGPERAWLPVVPSLDEDGDGALLDLRGLNERQAGDGGFIGVRGGEFVRLGTGAPIRFWGVNLAPRDLAGDALRRGARMLARRGVNLVRLHAPHYDTAGEVDERRVAHTLEAVETLKAEGIYSHLSIYYPLWITPGKDTRWLPGYDGSRPPFAALAFMPAFQERYRAWWRALLLTPSPRTGRTLVTEPAVAGLEIQNEDSLLFPTLESLPEVPRRALEAELGRWARARYGSPEAAQRAWGMTLPGDRAAEGRLALRPLWQIVRERTRRDEDTVRFLVDTQARFYAETTAWLRALGFRGVITTSNWGTADERVLGALEKLVATSGDFVDRHGYFGAAREGDRAAWPLRAGQTYVDRSALRFDDENGSGGRAYANPVMDASYGGKPSMLSEVSWERPSRFRSEAPLFLAAYAALQATDAVVHFRVEGDRWATRNRIAATPWPLTSPGQLGQFPAAALLFRQGLVSTGPVVARLRLEPAELLSLRGSPLHPGGSGSGGGEEAFVSEGPIPSDRSLDPLLHLVGRVEVSFDGGPTAAMAAAPPGSIDRARKRVRSGTGELELDYGEGLLTIDAPSAQGAVGALGARGTVETADLRISSSLEVGAIVVVALDGKPLRTSDRMLLQVMSEEQATGFASEPAGRGRRLLEPGHDPWTVREIEGTVVLTRPDAERLTVTALDLAGRPVGAAVGARRIELAAGVFHYLVAR